MTVQSSELNQQPGPAETVRQAPRSLSARLLTREQAADSFRRGLYITMWIAALLSGLYCELVIPLYGPVVTVFGNSLYYLDILLPISAGLWLLTKNRSKLAESPVIWLILFVGWAAIVGLLRSFQLDLEYKVWVREFRSVAYFAFIVLLAEALDTRKRIIAITHLLLWTSLGVAAMATYVRIFHTDIVPEVNLLVYQAGAVRVFQVLGVERALYAVSLAAGLLLARRQRPLWFFVAGNGITLIVGLTRGIYLALVAALVVMYLSFGGIRVMPRLLIVLSATLAILLGISGALDMVTGEEVSGAFVTRLLEIQELSTREGNVGGRLTESEVVWSFLSDRPDALFFGQGLGGNYDDPYNQLIDDIWSLGDLRYSYVHNGYLWTILRSGLIGAFFLYAFCLALIYKCLRLARRTTDTDMQGILLGVAAVFVAVLASSWSGQPLWAGMRMSALLIYAAVGLAAIRLAQTGVGGGNEHATQPNSGTSRDVALTSRGSLATPARSASRLSP